MNIVKVIIQLYYRRKWSTWNGRASITYDKRNEIVHGQK